ncbi:13382_t:CDS:2, partial [Gigaspora rosea]
LELLPEKYTHLRLFKLWFERKQPGHELPRENEDPEFSDVKHHTHGLRPYLCDLHVKGFYQKFYIVYILYYKIAA